MIERSIVETVLARTAVAAFTHYPGKETEEPGYTVEEDVDWALAPAGGLDAGSIAQWRQRIGDVIMNPAADRRAFVADLVSLAED